MEKSVASIRNDDRDRDLAEIFNRQTKSVISEHLKNKYQLPLEFLNPPKIETVDFDREIRTYAFTFFNEMEFGNFGLECRVKLDLQTVYPIRERQVEMQKMQKTIAGQQHQQRRQYFAQFLAMDQNLVYSSDEYSRTMINQIAITCIDDESFNELIRLPVRSLYARSLIADLQSKPLLERSELSRVESEQSQQTVQLILQNRQQRNQQQMQQAGQMQQRQQQQAQAEPVEVASKLIKVDSFCTLLRSKGGLHSLDEIRTKNSDLFKFAEKHHMLESSEFDWSAR